MSSINHHESLNSLKRTTASTRSSPHFLSCGCANVETIKHNLLQAAETISQLRTENSKLQNRIKDSNIEKFDSLELECKYLRNQLAYCKKKGLKNTKLRQKIEELKELNIEKDKALEFQERKLKEIKESVKSQLQEVKNLVESNFVLKHKLDKAMESRKNYGIGKLSPLFNEFYLFLKQFKGSSIYAAIKGSLGSKCNIEKMLQDHKCTQIIKILIQLIQYVLKFIDVDKGFFKSSIIKKKIEKQAPSISEKQPSIPIDNGTNPMHKEPEMVDQNIRNVANNKIKSPLKIKLESSHEIKDSESQNSNYLHPDFSSIFLMKKNKKDWNKTVPLRKLSEEPSENLRHSLIKNDPDHKCMKFQSSQHIDEEFKENMDKHALVQLTVSTIKGANTEDNSEDLEAEDHKEFENKSDQNEISSEAKPNQQSLEGKSNKMHDLFEARRRKYKVQRLATLQPYHLSDKFQDDDIIISSNESSISSKERFDSMKLLEIGEKDKLRKTKTIDKEKLTALVSQADSEIVSLNNSVGSSNNEGANVPHRSRWNFSQLPNLRIPPPLETSDKPEERPSKPCQVRQKSPNFSGELHKSRFREYMRPMMKEEKNWDSVDAFFRSQSK